MAGGLAVARFLGGETALLPARLVGVILVLVGAGVCGLSLWRYRQVSEVVEAEGMPVTPPWVAVTMVAGLLVAAALIFSLIFLQ